MKVFLCETIHPKAVAFLEERGEIVGDWSRIGEVDALINRALTIGADEMDRMPNLKVIAVHGTGTDGVDLKEAKKRGIQVVYAPHLNANSVAELNVGLLLAVYRRIVLAKDFIENVAPTLDENSRMKEAQSVLRGFELRGKTLGQIGFGAIGARTAEILRLGFGMNVIAYDPFLTEERANAFGCKRAERMEQVLEEADVVCLSLPLTEETRGMMGAEQFASMKDGAVFLNASRGPLMDEAALYEALKSGKLGGAACDVFHTDFPEKENPLLALPNFVATPHLGANTDEALYYVGRACAEQIVDVLEGREPKYPVKM
ncbi:MAG: hydroxyacid dehydrogenase [Lachnoclostridium sp.]|nr:hydroxyacid dehydrogenase [Lachnoclostridium sp.]